MRNRTVGAVGIAIILLMAFAALFAGFLAPYSPYDQAGGTFEKPSRSHLLGTNDIGQDILSELIYGTRVSLAVGALSAAVSISVGVAVGVASGWYGGSVDRLFAKVTSFFMTIPFLPSVIILASFSNSGILGMSAILGLLSWTDVARVLRASTMQLRERPYIRMIRGMGAPSFYILTRHVFRELLPYILYRTVARVKSGILAESSMSFLGIGSPVAKSWGSIIYYAQARNALITGAWLWWIVPPGLCICAVSMGLMMLAYRMETKSDSRMEAEA